MEMVKLGSYLAIAGSIVGAIIGGVLASVVSYRLSAKLLKAQNREVAAARLRATFAPEMAIMRERHQSKTIDEELPRDIIKALNDGISRYWPAVEEFRLYLSDEKKRNTIRHGKTIIGMGGLRTPESLTLAFILNVLKRFLPLPNRIVAIPPW